MVNPTSIFARPPGGVSGKLETTWHVGNAAGTLAEALINRMSKSWMNSRIYNIIALWYAKSATMQYYQAN